MEEKEQEMSYTDVFMYKYGGGICYRQRIVYREKFYGHCSYAEMDKQDIEFLDAYFEHEVRPLLSPQIVGKKQPFPFLKNKEI